MGNSQSVESGNEKRDGILSNSGGVLEANFSGGWFHNTSTRLAKRSYIFGNNKCHTSKLSILATPLERRFVKIEMMEWEDESKRILRFDVTREALGVPTGWVYRVDGLFLVVDGQSEKGRLHNTLSWVEVPDIETVKRVSGMEIEALLSATDSMQLTTEPYDNATRFAISLPFGPHAMGVPLCVRAGLAAAGQSAHLMVSIFVAPVGPVGMRQGKWEWDRLFNAPVCIPEATSGEALVPLEFPKTDLLLRAIVMALPFRRIRVIDVALLLDDKVLAYAPGMFARAAFEMRYKPNNNGWTHLCLPLAVDFEKNVIESVHNHRSLCGELDLTTPVVHMGRLVVRVRFECMGCGFTDFYNKAIVQACVLRV